jgi:hypothetical protein
MTGLSRIILQSSSRHRAKITVQVTRHTMSRSQRSLHRHWEYINSPTIHVASDGTMIAGCLTSYHTGDSLAAGRSKSALLSIHAAEQNGQKRDIPEDTIFSIYKETVENLGPNTWSLVQQNKRQGKASFETAFKSRAQQYIDTGLPPDTDLGTARTKKLKLLTGSKLLPSCSATALVPGRSHIDDPSFTPQADIVWKSENEIDHVKVGLPCSIKTLGVYHPPSVLNVLSQAEPRTVPMTFTGSSNWWKEDIVAGSEADLKPSIEFELSRLATLPHGATRDPVQADVERNIASLFGAYLERNIKITASVARDLEVQRKDHPRLSEMSKWRIKGVPGEPSVLLEMQPVDGQEQPVPGNILVRVPGHVLDRP